MRTRSVVAPTDHALRAIVRLLPAVTAPPPPGASGPPSSAPSVPGGRHDVAEARVGAGPPKRIWSTRTALVHRPAPYGPAHIHLVKAAHSSALLVDDLSFL